MSSYPRPILDLLAQSDSLDKGNLVIPLSGTALQEVTRPTLLSHKVSTSGVPEVRKIFAKSVR
jgi:hypothetical protein